MGNNSNNNNHDNHNHNHYDDRHHRFATILLGEKGFFSLALLISLSLQNLGINWFVVLYFPIFVHCILLMLLDLFPVNGGQWKKLHKKKRKKEDWSPHIEQIEQVTRNNCNKKIGAKFFEMG